MKEQPEMQHHQGHQHPDDHPHEHRADHDQPHDHDHGHDHNKGQEHNDFRSWLSHLFRPHSHSYHAAALDPALANVRGIWALKISGSG